MLTEAEKDLLADLERVQTAGQIEPHVARGLVSRGLVEGAAEKRQLTEAGAALLSELRARKR